MKEDLIKLYNTLKLISTKGDDTKIMGKCLEYTEALINRVEETKTEDEERS